MGNRTKPALVGLFVLGGLVLAFVGLLAFGGLRWFEPSQQAVVYFNEPLSGLSAGAPVTFRGIEIGSVSRLAIKGDPETFSVVMPVFLRLRPGDINFTGEGSPRRLDIDRLVANGLRAQIRPRSLLTGQMAVELDFYPDDPVRFRHSEDEEESVTEIPSKPSDFQQARNAVEQFPWKASLEKAVVTLESLTSLSRTLEKEMTGIGGKLHTTLDESRALISRARETLSTLEADAGSALGSVERLGEEGRDQFRDRGEELEQVLERASGLLERTERVANNLEDMTHPRSPERDDLRTVLRELTAATTALRRFSEKVERRPNALLFDDGEDSP
ncbi:ABC-type transporter Mla subunit MlaD [Halospina denitrificans]|uniref:ABC-type transporter Mla subunit MlaD n=1 Tax=Halospina denitrificans TaxID=332522 RepID=A0A4R7K0W7_9GAMM|nr:MlaD family protein [Halospina denitrificans]TDT43984.1 ABC-type transporter Mla subunit MlaD [Halospina denitrificans]